MLERHIPNIIIEKTISPFAHTKKPAKLMIVSSISASLTALFYTVSQNIAAALFLYINIHTMLIAIESSRKNPKKSIDTIHDYNRVSDAFIYTGLAASPYIPVWLGILALVSAVLLPHLGYRLRAFTKTKNPSITRLDTTSAMLLATLLSPITTHTLIIGAISVITLNTISLATTILSKNTPKL